MKIFIAGDVAGSAGRDVFARTVRYLKDEEKVDAIIVNGENAAGGRGITPSIAEDFFNLGVDAITLGDHTWDQRDIFTYLDQEPRIIRPLNFAPGSPGKGYTVVQTAKGPMTIINLVGRVFMRAEYDCPFRAVDTLLQNHGSELSPIKLVDIHAEATSEKQAMGWFLDGRVSCVYGTHTHVQTADERLLHKGTAYISDLGFTGAKDSVIGCTIAPIVTKFQTGLPQRFEQAQENPACDGILIEVVPETGKTIHIERRQLNP